MANGNIQQVSTSTLSNQNIVTALLVHTFTNTTRIRKLFVNIFLDQVAGNGDYIAHVTIQRAGAGSAYTSIKTTLALATGVTSGVFTSIPITLNATDVMRVYLIGLASDTTTPDIIVDVNEEADDHIVALIESQRGHHTYQGSIFYVDGTSGSDVTGTGTRFRPYKTISTALTVCTDNAHDVIYCLANTGANPSIISETATVTVNKRYVFIRGPGRDVSVDLTGNGYVFDITAVGVEISGLIIMGNGAGASGGVKVSTADFAYLHDLWIQSPTQDGIQCTVSNNTLIDNCLITSPGRDGVRVDSGSGAGQYTRITNCTIRDAVGSAVDLLGSDASESHIRFNVIRDNVVGVTVAAGVLDTVITDNRFINNTTRISDAGTRTMDEWNNLNTDTSGRVLLQLAQPGVTIPTVTTLTNGSVSIATIVADYARRTGDYSILTQPDIRTALGMAAANLDAQLALLVPGSSIELNSEITEIHTS